MARMPGVAYIGPTPNMDQGGMLSVDGLVLHIQQGTESGSIAWFKNPAAEASAHFLNPKTGPLVQLVDTADKAWAEAAGNPHWVSVENEGFVPDALTPSQLENVAQLYAWLHRTYSVPLQSTDSPSGSGLGWHGMGGVAWGNHPDCPGGAIKSQRPAILARVHEILGTTPKFVPFPGGWWFTPGRTSPIIAAMHERLIAVGCDRYKTNTNLDVWGSGDVASYQAWQLKCFPGASTAPGGAADGIPGQTSWDRLQVPNPGA